MSGGTCEATAYQEFGFQTAAVCVALGNYHNCGPRNRIAAEFGVRIDQRDLRAGLGPGDIGQEHADHVGIVGPGDELEQHDVLWKFLVPSRGAAAIVQGEVIRITGKVADELFRNGGGNWDADYRKMIQSLGAYFRMGHALPADLLAGADEAIAYIKKSGDGDEEIKMLSLFAVKWVKLNPQPVPLAAPDYDR